MVTANIGDWYMRFEDINEEENRIVQIIGYSVVFKQYRVHTYTMDRKVRISGSEHWAVGTAHYWVQIEELIW